jgi:prophage regulatory protein
MTVPLPRLCDNYINQPSQAAPPQLLDWKAVHRAIGFTQVHIRRLEKAGRFPPHLRLAGKRNVWLKSDILAWMQAKVDKRSADPIEILSTDRFIQNWEMRIIFPYSVDHLRKLEKRGLFPSRILIGARRTAWLEREVTSWILINAPGSAGSLLALNSGMKSSVTSSSVNEVQNRDLNSVDAI